MEEYSIDFSGVTDREGMHRCLKEALPLPPWYGNNLDALYDALTDFSGSMTIRLTGWEELENSIPGSFESFRRLMRDVQEECPGISVLFEQKEAQPEFMDQDDDPGFFQDPFEF